MQIWPLALGFFLDKPIMRLTWKQLLHLGMFGSDVAGPVRGEANGSGDAATPGHGRRCSSSGLISELSGSSACVSAAPSEGDPPAAGRMCEQNTCRRALCSLPLIWRTCVKGA